VAVTRVALRVGPWTTGEALRPTDERSPKTGKSRRGREGGRRQRIEIGFVKKRMKWSFPRSHLVGSMKSISRASVSAGNRVLPRNAIVLTSTAFHTGSFGVFRNIFCAARQRP